MTLSHQGCRQGAKLLPPLEKVIERKTEGRLNPENPQAARAAERRKGLWLKSVLLKETDYLTVI